MATRTKTKATTKTATVTRIATSSIRTNCRLSRILLSLVLAAFLPLATASCGVEFLYPQPGLTFYYLDTINVTYTSNFSDPILFGWCGGASPSKKFQTTAPDFNGSVLVLLNFSSSDPCWFDLRPNTPACGDNSPQFTLLPIQRAQSSSQTTIGLLSATASTSTPSSTGASDHPHGPPDHGRGELSGGAKAGIAVAVVGASLVVLGMAACFYFRRRKRSQEAALAGHIVSRDRQGKNGREKQLLSGSSAGSNRSNRSNRSDAPLQVQPVYDGFPGSTGYDDVRSLESSTYLQSPQSPSTSSAGGFFPSERSHPSERNFMTERDELHAARMHSAPIAASVVSYGPNPVTPSLTPRPSTRFNDRSDSSGSGDRHEEYYTPSVHSMPMHPPKSVPPLVVSYGPNRITPTPVISSATVPPDDAVLNRVPDLPEFPVMSFPSHPFPSHEPQSPHDAADTPVRYDLTDEPISPAPPLPPYASTADFYAMEKGAIRKIEEPTAQAELPPTKDGYYHFGDHGTEYELPGAAPQNAQHHPHQPFRSQPDGRGRGREVDEQKFLLSDVEIARMRQQKAAKKVAQPAGESYEMQPGRASTSRSQRQEQVRADKKARQTDW